MSHNGNTPDPGLEVARDLVFELHKMLQDNPSRDDELVCGLGRELRLKDLHEISPNLDEARQIVITSIADLLSTRVRKEYEHAELDLRTTEAGTLQISLILRRTVRHRPASP